MWQVMESGEGVFFFFFFPPAVDIGNNYSLVSSSSGAFEVEHFWVFESYTDSTV